MTEEVEGALRSLVLRCGVVVKTHPEAPLWLRIGEIADAIEAKNDALNAALSLAANERQRVMSEIADAMHGPTMQPLAERVRGYVETCARLGAEKAEALAACAEMRAALEAVMRADNAFHEQECDQDPCTCWVVEARVVLSRTNLGRGWASPEVVRRCYDVLRKYLAWRSNEVWEACRPVLADLDALLNAKDKS